MNGCRSKPVNVMSSAAEQCFVPAIAAPVYLEISVFSILENNLFGDDNNSTMMAVVPSSGVRLTEVESLNSDIGRVSEWYGLWGMKFKRASLKLR